MISFEDFKKLDLRIAKILKAEAIEGSEKLLKLEIDIGKEKRQIIAGIAKSYKPQELIGKEIVVLVDLEPKTLMGVESHGMLLAANDNEKSILLKPERDVPPGTKVS
jgi:methionine--tRNA ligase beta chain